MNSTGLATPTVAPRLLRLLPGSLRSQSGGGSTWPSGWPGDFVEMPLDAWAVKGGDFVTVRVDQKGKRSIAIRIAVTVTAE